MSNKFNSLYTDDSDTSDNEKCKIKETPNENNDNLSINKVKDKDIALNNNNNTYSQNETDNIFTTIYSKKKNNNRYNKNNTNIYNVRGNVKNIKYTESFEILPYTSDMLNDKLYFNYKIFAHHINDKQWNYQNYFNILTFNIWKDIPGYFNSIDEDNLMNYNLFIMKNEISPMWEDNNNRFASRCQIKIDSIEGGKKLLYKLFIYMANNNLLKNSSESRDCVNGLIFNPKKMTNYSTSTKSSHYSIIEVWFKNNYENNTSQLSKIFNKDIADEFSKYSIRIKPIKPEY